MKKYMNHTIVKTNIIHNKDYEGQAYKRREVNLYRVLGEFAKGPKDEPLLTTLNEAKLYIKTMKGMDEFLNKNQKRDIC